MGGEGKDGILFPDAPGVGQGASSESIRGNMDFFAPSVTKMQEMCNKTPAGNAYWIGNHHFVYFIFIY